LKLSFVNANASPEIVGEEKLSSYSNYFLGRDSCRWRGHVANYARVVARDVWSGIDVEYRPQLEGVETLYRVRPGGDPSEIRIQYEGADAPLSVDANGNLLLKTSLGIVKEKAPYAYQIVNGSQVEVPSRYRIITGGTCSVDCEGFDAGKELVIDPQLYITGFAGSFIDGVENICTNQQDELVICGSTGRTNLPTTPGAYLETPTEEGADFITKLNAAGDSIIFSTYFLGARFGMIRVDSTGRYFYVTQAYPTDWPLTENAFDTVCQNEELGVACISADGSDLVFCTYLGGTWIETLGDCQLDALGRLYICGTSDSPDFPVTDNAFFNPIDRKSVV
jgi:hypothetical protein